jgi:predicted amidophosphoribosyltransferase
MDARPQPAGFGNCARCPYLESGPDMVDGKRVLIYDDVYTEGLTLSE